LTEQRVIWTLPRVVRRKCLPAAAATVAALVCAAPSPAGLTSAEQALLGELNRVRAANGVAPLRVDAQLEQAARAHSADMLRRDYFSHLGFASRIRSSGARGPSFGENLAWGTGAAAAAAAIVRMWLGSPGHRENLLRPGFRRVGLATPRGEFLGYRGARVVTVDFAGT
jgi:uncharacterized protein YkwD